MAAPGPVLLMSLAGGDMDVMFDNLPSSAADQVGKLNAGCDQRAQRSGAARR
jgi:hypothetical protein